VSSSRITIIQGHPDASGNHFGHALAEAYADACRKAGHELRVVNVAELDFPLLRTKEDFEHGNPPVALRQSAEDIRWANHLVIFFPLWLGTLPALLKGFFEQVLRPEGDYSFKNILRGKTARIVVTMGMPAAVYRWYFRAHGLRGFESGVLKFCGVRRISESLIGYVENPAPKARKQWLDKMGALGGKGK
jgi:putative NADPH-quinone reductase